MTTHGSPLAGVDLDGMGAGYGGIVRLSPEAVLSLGSMEGLAEPPVSEAPPAPARPWTGYLLAALAAALAYALHYLPVYPFLVTDGTDARRPISAALLAIVAGLAIRNTVALPAGALQGAKAIVHGVIPYAIVCIGAGLNLAAVVGLGPRALLVMVAAVAVAYGSAYLVARWLGLGHKTAALLGVGTGICGSSAIVAAAPLLDADEQDMILAVGTVNLFGMVAMIALPLGLVALPMDAEQFGIWCGAAIHAVPQVLAAADAFVVDRTTAVEWATLVKLGRVTLLAPLVLLLALAHARSAAARGDGDGPTIRYHRLVPWFIWGFLIAASLNTAGLLPTLRFEAFDQPVALQAVLGTVGSVLLTLALAAIGLSVNLRALCGVGGRAAIAGLTSTVALAAATLVMVLALVR